YISACSNVQTFKHRPLWKHEREVEVDSGIRRGRRNCYLRDGTMNTAESSVADVARAVDTLWVLLGAAMVFFMQAGFAMLEAGSVSIKNTKNILIKNIGDSAMGAIGWWLFGNGLAFGQDSGGFLGTTGFALKDESMFGTTTGEFVPLAYANWIFQWAFAASATTIVSGAMAERATFGAYVLHSFLITSFIYPIVAHWAWSEEGWASARRADDDEDGLLFGCGVIDFAGSGVVHVTGGMAALVGIFILGPRVGRFNEDGTSNTMPQQSAVLQVGKKHCLGSMVKAACSSYWVNVPCTFS
ncbi:unnamed protein product, partial [Ectocarpus fasciculatus]